MEEGCFKPSALVQKIKYKNRKIITTIIRMRTGHCLTKEHQFRIGVADSPFCECGTIENLNHIFFQCYINSDGVFDLYRDLQNGGVSPWVFLVWLSVQQTC